MKHQRRTGQSRGRWVSAVTTTLAMIAGFFVVPSVAQAATITDGFDPGFIISDELFYDGNAMTVGEIQTFLNQRVSRCTLGDPGREKGKPTNWNGPTHLAQECLKDARFNTQTRPADQYCRTYGGANNESAAQIISKVAKACDISPRVILITLEKEQSLVTDDWPTVKMFDIAMGFACPDTGPNNTANCDAAYFGFYNQVYWGARQFQVYKANPNRYNYKPFQSNTILWHPNQSCGSSTVHIQNWATAALYIYTPYRPNASALRAGWGTGDSCASYGNRNFYNFYKSWFGQPNVKFQIHQSVAAYASTHIGWLGNPSAKAVTTSAGTYQEFSGGVVFAPSGGTVSGMTTASPILKAFRAAGFVTGSWGWPKAPATNLGSSGNNRMVFAGGTVIESGGVRAILVDPQLLTHWNNTGGFKGTLGAPLSTAKKANSAIQQTFAKGSIVRDSSGTVRLIDSRFYDAWNTGGGVSHSLGVPTGNASAVSANGGGAVYPLSKGAMYRQNNGTITTLPSGTMLTAYTGAGGPSGSWGWPVSAQRCTSTECIVDFTGGVAVWSQLRGTQFTAYTNIPNVQRDPSADKNLLGGSVG